MDGSSWGRGSELAIGLLWHHEVKGQRVHGLWHDQAQGRCRSSPLCQVPSTHVRDIGPGDKVSIFPQALPEAQLAELHVEVPENYGGNFPLYLTKVSLSAGLGYPPPESFLPYLQYSFLFLLWLTFKHCYP